jgi:hypothetical protein
MDYIPRPTALREPPIELMDRLFNRTLLLRLLLTARRYIWESTLKSLDIAMTYY